MSTEVAENTAVEYRTLERFPGYRFGSDGSVWSCLRRNGHKPRTIGNAWRPLVPVVVKDGYLRVSIRNTDGRLVFRAVHRIILEAFVGPCPVGCQARHFPDHDPKNNSIGNLQWGTILQNRNDSRVSGRLLRGERHPRAKLTLQQVQEIRRLRAAGYKLRDIGKRFGVNHAHISDIARGHVWAQ